MDQFLSNLKDNFDMWAIFGAIAQTCFFLRFVIQWLVSEVKKESIIPIAFWYFSVMGSTGLLIYSIKRADPVFICGHLFNNIVYIRNLMLISRKAKLEKQETK